MEKEGKVVKQYHIGFAIRGKSLVIQAARCVDFLDCEIYDYMGVRETTKAKLNANRYDVLRLMQARKPNVYGKLKYSVLE